MIERWHRFAAGFVAGVLLSAGVVGVVYSGTATRRARGTGPEPLVRTSAQMRGIVQAVMMYGQTHNGRFPDPSADWHAPLVDAGLVPIELFQDPKLPAGTPRFFYLPPTPPDDFGVSPTEAVLVQNPATTEGRGGLIAYNDNHVDFLPEPGFSKYIASAFQSASPRRGPPP